jgi:hypothetical protein
MHQCAALTIEALQTAQHGLSAVHRVRPRVCFRVGKMGVCMSKMLSTAVIAATFALASTPAAAATTLTFSNACGGVCTDYGIISQGYGDIAGLLNISYRSVASQGSNTTAGDVATWSTGYGALSDVAYGASGATMEIMFQLLDATKQITFNSVNYAAWSNNGPTTTQLGLFSLAGGGPISASASVVAPTGGSASWAPNVTSANGFKFHFGADAYYSAIDNLTFTISDVNVAGAVPEPATWLSMILGFGLIGTAARRRTSRRAVAII